MNYAQVLLVWDESSHAVFIQEHDAVNGIVGPGFIWRLNYNSAPCVDVAASVTIVNVRGWEAVEIDIISGSNIFMTRSTVYSASYSTLTPPTKRRV